MNETLFELKNVSAGYLPDRRVLQEVSFALERGERVGLCGPNGAGKSTLLELMVGLVQPFAGELRAFGRARRDEKDFIEVRRRAALLFEDADDQLFHMTVGEDVAFGPFNLGWPRDRVARAVRDTLSALALSGYEERVTYRLSRGEKRMVSLATVLVMEPDVLLLDEPTAGLDEAHVARLTDVLGAKAGTMLVVSHDRPFLDTVTDRVWTMENGRLV